jgi:hypothetical protein
LLRAELDTRSGCIGCTSNEEVNLLFVRHAREDFRVPNLWMARERHVTSPGDQMVARIGARVLFAAPRDLDLWVLRLGKGEAQLKTWQSAPPEVADGEDVTAEELTLGELPEAILPLVMLRGRKVAPVDETTTRRKGDRMVTATMMKGGEGAEPTMASQGWFPVPDEDVAGGGENG